MGSIEYRRGPLGMPINWDVWLKWYQSIKDKLRTRAKLSPDLSNHHECGEFSSGGFCAMLFDGSQQHTVEQQARVYEGAFPEEGYACSPEAGKLCRSRRVSS